MAKIRKINVSEIDGRSPFNNDSNAVMPAGTVVVYEDNGKYVLRVHDGVTNGGVALSAGQVPVIFNGNDGIVLDNLNDGIAALFNNGDVYITGGEGLRFTGINEVDGFDVSMLRFWNGEGRHSTDNDPTELVTLNVGNDAAQGAPTEGFFKIVTEKETGSNKTWKFDSDGVLTLPVSGDIVDSTGASVLGGGSSVDNNIWIETFTTNDIEGSVVQIATSVEYDADGNIFALFSHSIPGEAQETYKSVAKLTPTGAILWQVRFGANLNTDGWGLAYDGSDTVYVAGSTSGTPLTYNLATLTKIDAADGTIVWSKTYDFGANSRSAVVDVDSDLDPIMVGWADTPGEENNRVITTKVDQATGSVVWSRTLDGQGDDEAYGMAVGPTGEVVAVGYMSQYDEVGEPYPVTPLTGSGVNRLVINRSDLSNDTFTDTWKVSGTGITGYIGVSQINAYTELTGTVREGAGTPNFAIEIDGTGTIINSAGNGGTNYRVGHKILLDHSLVGGADSNADIIITVTAIDDPSTGVITGVSAAYFGTGGGVEGYYIPLSGTNYQTGSGLTFDLELDSGSTYTEHPFNITAAGTNYVDGDVVVIPGTQLGGTSPENDLTITVSTIVGGVSTLNSFTGTQQTTTYRIITEDFDIDFGSAGTWTLNDVSVDTDARMLVVKYAADGTIAWQKAVEFDSNYDCKGADADIDADGNIYVCGSYDNFGGSAMSLVKLNSSGVAQWSRQVIGNCQDFATSVVVGPDNNLYLSGVTIDDANEDIVWVVAKYSTGGTVVWQRLINNTASWTFTGDSFVGNGGGSNIAVGTDYVALAGGFGNLMNNEPPTATVVQIDTNGTLFSTGDWDFTGASFSGNLDDTASSITVLDAGKTAGTATPTVEDFIVEDDSSNFLEVTRYSLAGGNDSLVNGEYTLVLGNTGTVTLPAGGTITEGVVTSNPTIQLTPASPDVASQKLVIKGGGAYTVEDNGIGLNWNEINPLVGDTVQIYVNSDTYADQTLYWWVSPAGAGILDTESGTVVLTGSSGEFSILIDSDDYEFRIRVSPEDNNYDPASIGVETQLFNSASPNFGDHHLHLTTGDLTETSIILGTDDHNVRTTTDGGVEITTPSESVTPNVWTFDTDGNLTVPGGIVAEYQEDFTITTSYLGMFSPPGPVNQTFTFTANGNLTFPDTTTQITAYVAPTTGNSVVTSQSSGTFITRNGMIIGITADGTLQATFDSVISIKGRVSINGGASTVIASPNGATTINVAYPITSALVADDHVVVTLVDESAHRVYRITAIIRDQDATPGSEFTTAYVIIEQLQ